MSGEDLIAACKKCDIARVKELVGTAKVPANFEKYTKGTWGAHKRESPIHHALMKVRQFFAPSQFFVLASLLMPTKFSLLVPVVYLLTPKDFVFFEGKALGP